MSLRSNTIEMSFITEAMLFLDWYLSLHPTWTTQSYACAERIVQNVFLTVGIEQWKVATKYQWEVATI